MLGAFNKEKAFSMHCETSRRWYGSSSKQHTVIPSIYYPVKWGCILLKLSILELLDNIFWHKLSTFSKPLLFYLLCVWEWLKFAVDDGKYCSRAALCCKYYCAVNSCITALVSFIAWCPASGVSQRFSWFSSWPGTGSIQPSALELQTIHRFSQSTSAFTLKTL